MAPARAVDRAGQQWGLLVADRRRCADYHRAVRGGCALLQWIGLLGCLFIGRMAIASLYEDLSARTRMRIRCAAAKTLGDPDRFSAGIANPKDIIFVAFFPQLHRRHPLDRQIQSDAADCTVGAGDCAILPAYITCCRGTRLQRAAGDLVPSALLLLGGGGGSGAARCGVCSAEAAENAGRETGPAYRV
ncbi:hypothetical protein M8494_32975 [Serratia ureilytica]